MASGLSAVFKAPLGTAIFALEVLYIKSKFESKELMFVIFRALVAYTITGFLFGWQPLFNVPANLEVTKLQTFDLILILGVLSGFFAVFVSNVFYYTRDFFRKIPIKPHFKPAIGALIVGIIAIWYPQILGGGYGWIQEGIYGALSIKFMLALIFLNLLPFFYSRFWREWRCFCSSCKNAAGSCYNGCGNDRLIFVVSSFNSCRVFCFFYSYGHCKYF